MWFVVNQLSHNVLEINFMLFSNYKKASTKVKINDIEMIFVSKFTRCFNRMITLELSKSFAIMHTSAKYFLDKNARLKLYYSQYLLCVSSCCEVWGNTYKTNIDCIYLLQKQLARIVSNIHYCHLTNGLS